MIAGSSDMIALWAGGYEDFEGQTPIDVAKEQDTGLFIFLFQTWWDRFSHNDGWYSLRLEERLIIFMNEETARLIAFLSRSTPLLPTNVPYCH
jgi:hypothetical protein